MFFITVRSNKKQFAVAESAPASTQQKPESETRITDEPEIYQPVRPIVCLKETRRSLAIIIIGLACLCESKYQSIFSLFLHISVYTSRPIFRCCTVAQFCLHLFLTKNLFTIVLSIYRHTVKQLWCTVFMPMGNKQRPYKERPSPSHNCF